jgi:hypothetical protein
MLQENDEPQYTLSLQLIPDCTLPKHTAPSPQPTSLTVFGGRLWFGAFNDMNQYELWVLDQGSSTAFTACRGREGCFIPQSFGNSLLQIQGNRLWFPGEQRLGGSGVGFDPFVFP